MQNRKEGKRQIIARKMSPMTKPVGMGPRGALAKTAVAHEDGDGQQKEVKEATLPSASAGTETLS